MRGWVEEGLAGLPFQSRNYEYLPDFASKAVGSGFGDGFDPDLALIDEESDGDFVEKLRLFKSRYPRCQILLAAREESTLTPQSIQPVAIRHWFSRPFEPGELGRVLAAAGRSLQRQWRDEHRHTRSLHGFERLVGRDPKLLEAISMARKVAESPQTSVLILGETGTGKGVLAQAIHAESPRSSGPFVEINCGAIPEALMESELFGHVRGAFTSAHTDKPGLLELADAGSAFLDEIGELDMSLQAKVLKFLDGGSLRRVQGLESIHVDVRIIAATNRDLEVEVEEKNFRLDLYHRLNVIMISLPPLRARVDDIPLLADHYIGQISQRLRGRKIRWSTEARRVLQGYTWPGNVRELINLTERMVLVAEDRDEIGSEDLPQIFSKPPVLFQVEEQTQRPIIELPPDGISLKDVERAFLEAALAQTAGNVTEAARLLRMSRGSLRYRLEKLGLRDKASRRRGRPMRRRRAA